MVTGPVTNLRWRLARWIAGEDITRLPADDDQPVWIVIRGGPGTVAWIAVERFRMQKRNDIWRHTYGHREGTRGYHHMDGQRGRPGRFVGTLR